MTPIVSEEEIRKAVKKVMHPAINCSLVDLGIVQDVTVDKSKVVVTIAFPFPNIPIADFLINSVREPLEKLGLETQIETKLMDPQERQRFMAMEKDNWKGAGP